MLLSVLSVFAGITADLFDANDPNSMLVLVNRDNKLHYTFEPQELVLPNVQASEGKEKAIYMREEAAGALEKLFQGAAVAGHNLYAISGYRSYNQQKGLYENKVNAVGEKRAMLVVAPPGASEHQLGLAMDINGDSTLKLGLVEEFGASPEGQWVNENAHRYGFIIRYKEDMTHITGYAWEPWHLRYVGIDTATEVYELDITFEEYHDILQQRRLDAWSQVDAEENEQ